MDSHVWEFYPTHISGNAIRTKTLKRSVWVTAQCYSYHRSKRKHSKKQSNSPRHSWKRWRKRPVEVVTKFPVKRFILGFHVPKFSKTLYGRINFILPNYMKEILAFITFIAIMTQQAHDFLFESIYMSIKIMAQTVFYQWSQKF